MLVGSKDAELKLVLGLGGGGEMWASLGPAGGGEGERSGEGGEEAPGEDLSGEDDKAQEDSALASRSHCGQKNKLGEAKRKYL